MKKLLLGVAAAACLAGSLATANAQTFNIFPVNQVWKYNATASDATFCLNGTGWETTGYDDSAWSSGPGGFTGGENTAATLTSLAGLLNTTSLPAPTPSSGRPQYFRTHFNVTAGQVPTLTLVLSNRIDDQAVFYLNGTRVADYRHPNNPEVCDAGGAGGDEATVWVVITLSSNALSGIVHGGDNLLAVSVHQNAVGSSDMVFCCILSGETFIPPPPPPISFTNGGTGIITFDTPPPASQWSTRTWGGASADPADAATLDTYAKTNDASIITDPLTGAAGTSAAPPAAGGAAQYADGGFIQTRPTGVSYEGIMATLTNNSGSSQNGIGVSYDFTVNSPVAEEVNGHLVYASTTGTPGSWVQIADISNLSDGNTAGTYPRSGTVDLSATPWAANTKLYILWVDDNGSGTPDGSMQIDNVRFFSLVPSPPHFTDLVDPTNRTVLQCTSTTLSAGIAEGFPAPTYQWYHNNNPIGGATSSSYTIASMQSSDAGTYFVRATNPNGVDNSHTATLTYVAVPFQIVSILGSTNGQEVFINLSRANDPALIDKDFPGFQFRVTERGCALCDVPITDGSLSNLNATTIVFSTGPRDPTKNYDVEILNDDPNFVRDLCLHATDIQGNFQLASPLFLLNIDDVQSWRYNDTGVDPGATWKDTGYDDSGWLSGRALFDGKKVSPIRTDITNMPIRTQLVLTNVAPFNFTNDIATYNFRTHISVPKLPNVLQAITFVDDGIALFINGNIALRHRDSATNTFTSYSNDPNPFSDVWFEGPLDLATNSVSVGDNVVAVELKQTTANSSDATMGLQLIGYYTTLPPAAPKITYTWNGTTLHMTWTSGTLQQKTPLGGPGAPAWSNVPGVVGNTKDVTPSSAGGKNFYRLVQ